MTGVQTCALPISGLERQQGGTISGVRVQETAILFQDDRLLPWRTVEQQLTDVLPRDRRRDSVRLLELVELGREAGVYPAELSGGMARRLALARCLALDARLYLLDEPFAGVDLPCAIRILERLKMLPASVLLVSHEPQILSHACSVLCWPQRGEWGPSPHTPAPSPGGPSFS